MSSSSLSLSSSCTCECAHVVFQHSPSRQDGCTTMKQRLCRIFDIVLEMVGRHTKAASSIATTPSRKQMRLLCSSPQRQQKENGWFMRVAQLLPANPWRKHVALQRDVQRTVCGTRGILHLCQHVCADCCKYGYKMLKALVRDGRVRWGSRVTRQ